jgi:L-2-amino-thiazoline-4-carboxylic acid hydrolase
MYDEYLFFNFDGKRRNMTISKEECFKKIYKANMVRGLSLYYIFKELRKKMSEQDTADLMFKAIFKVGQKVSGGHSDMSLEQFKESTIGPSADSRYLFKPEILESTADVLRVRMHDCPVKTAWKEAGATSEEIKIMCRIGDAMTFGMVDGEFELKTEYPESADDLCVYCFSTIKDKD